VVSDAFGMLDLLFFVFTVGILPVLVNKSTERGRFDWIHPYLREIWTLVFVFYSLVLLSQPRAQEILMLLHKYPFVVQYLLLWLIGGLLLCTYYWFAGQIFQESKGDKKDDLLERIDRNLQKLVDEKAPDEKIRDAAIERKKAEESLTEPQWTTTHVYTGKDIMLIVFFSSSSPKVFPIARIQCRVITPNNNTYSVGSSAEGFNVTSVTPANQFRYPRDFEAPPLSPGRYQVEWLLTAGETKTFLTDSFDVSEAYLQSLPKEGN